MKNAPVYYVVGQIRFNVVSRMSIYADDIQEQLRKLGYTLYEPQRMQKLQFEQSGQAVQGGVVEEVTWNITQSDRKAGFVLGQSYISFHTTHYTSKEEFLTSLLAGFAVVNKVVDLDHVSSLGLRYLDAIIPSEGESVLDYLNPGIHGVVISNEQRINNSCESVYKSQLNKSSVNGIIVARMHGR